METIKKCPRCKKDYSGFPAMSRVDNKTSICSPCGTEEGLDDYYGHPLRTDFIKQQATPHGASLGSIPKWGAPATMQVKQKE